MSFCEAVFDLVPERKKKTATFFSELFPQAYSVFLVNEFYSPCYRKMRYLNISLITGHTNFLEFTYELLSY